MGPGGPPAAYLRLIAGVNRTAVVNEPSMPGDGETSARPTPGSPPPRLWTADEANLRLASLRELLPRLRGWATRLVEARSELDRLARFWGDELDARDHPDHGLSGRLEAESRNLTRRLGECVSALRSEGIEVKQLESGLVDFYGLLDGELVLLCWKIDEPQVGHYHSLEGGFSGRRPLPSRSRSVPTDAGGTL
jgi:hypothetical protein